MLMPWKHIELCYIEKFCLKKTRQTKQKRRDLEQSLNTYELLCSMMAQRTDHDLVPRTNPIRYNWDSEKLHFFS